MLYATVLPQSCFNLRDMNSGISRKRDQNLVWKAFLLKINKLQVQTKDWKVSLVHQGNDSWGRV